MRVRYTQPYPITGPFNDLMIRVTGGDMVRAGQGVL